MIDLKKTLEKVGPTYKFSGVVPDGFVLVHEKTLEDLTNMKTWLDWRREIITINELNNKNFNNELLENFGS